jgi:hypothetical protein
MIFKTFIVGLPVPAAKFEKPTEAVCGKKVLQLLLVDLTCKEYRNSIKNNLPRLNIFRERERERERE